ncbi:hypothetical protein CGZ93_17830 [Enemella dayhoffiae]|uniref:DUF3987 domain-containing protein n=1 Tax=Enemella dayhoffiae TaxID=2016507 RepID=A0A255GLC6_9ACTN|nr:hypothetical protein [Enemella dayhoffiae]OYO16620.1 hypothetical protein CGZ93_17830 [Enemella dayhoffiae]
MTTSWNDLWQQPPARRPTPAGPLQPPGEATAYAQKALALECAELASTPEGGRNHTLNIAAFNIGQLIAAGHLGEQDARTHLTNAARQAGLTDIEIQRTLNSGLRGGHRSGPRQVEQLPEGWTVTEVSAEELHAEAAAPAATDQDPFWDSRPVLQHIRAFAHARLTSPWSMLGVTLIRTLACIPPHVVLPPLIGGPGSLNLFLAIVGPSGVGKGATEAAATDGVRQPHEVYTATVGSGEGIAHQYAKRVRGGAQETVRQSVVFSVPEIDTLGGLNARQGSTLMPQLRSAFSGETLGFGYADAQKRLIIDRHTYRLGLIVGVQPGRAHTLLNDADGGTPQRFIWLPATDPTINPEPDEAPPPWNVRGWTWRPELGTTRDTDGRYQLTVPDQVATTIREAHVARARGQGDALDGHSLFAREKVAQALALLDDRQEMSLEDWELAGHVMAMSDWTRANVQATLTRSSREADQRRAERDARRADVIDNTRAELQVDRAAKQLLRRLDKADDWLSQGRLQNSLRGDLRPLYDEVLDRLRDAHAIEIETRNAGGQEVTYVRSHR